jgi:hypothetical protein
MLIGCGCNCEPETASSIASGSSRNLNSVSQGLSDQSLPGPPLSFCGVCYNLPSEWLVTFESSWFKLLGNPLYYHNCQSSQGGTFLLRSYGAASLSPAAAQFLNFQDPAANVCTVWKSDQLALFTGKKNQDGTPNAACRNNQFGWSRVELVSYAIEPANSCSYTAFVLFFWTADFPGSYNNPNTMEMQTGIAWSWIVPALPECNTRNCVRCWGADFFFAAVGMPASPGAFMAWSPDPAITDWQTVAVCPA